MKRSFMLHRPCWIGLAIVAVSSGCTHNYYYGTAGGCPPVPTQVGQICEVPSGTVVTSNASTPVIGSGSSTQIVSTPQPQRIIIGQTAANQSYLGRSRWRRADPETSVVATTRADGALPDTSNK